MPGGNGPDDGRGADPARGIHQKTDAYFPFDALLSGLAGIGRLDPADEYRRALLSSDAGSGFPIGSPASRALPGGARPDP